MPRSQSRTPAARASARGTPRPKPRKPRTAKQAKDAHRGGEWGRGVAERLRTLKGAQSVRSFAERVGLAPSLVSNYLNGRRLPESPTLRAIAERTGVSLDWLLLGDGGDEPCFRGQDRTRAELQTDLAAYVRQQVANDVRARGGEWANLTCNGVAVDGAALMRAACAQASQSFLALAARCRDVHGRADVLQRMLNTYRWAKRAVGDARTPEQERAFPRLADGADVQRTVAALLGGGTLFPQRPYIVPVELMSDALQIVEAAGALALAEAPFPAAHQAVPCASES